MAAHSPGPSYWSLQTSAQRHLSRSSKILNDSQCITQNQTLICSGCYISVRKRRIIWMFQSVGCVVLSPWLKPSRLNAIRVTVKMAGNDLNLYLYCKNTFFLPCDPSLNSQSIVSSHCADCILAWLPFPLAFLFHSLRIWLLCYISAAYMCCRFTLPSTYCPPQQAHRQETWSI